MLRTLQENRLTETEIAQMSQLIFGSRELNALPVLLKPELDLTIPDISTTNLTRHVKAAPDMITDIQPPLNKPTVRTAQPLWSKPSMREIDYLIGRFAPPPGNIISDLPIIREEKRGPFGILEHTVEISIANSALDIDRSSLPIKKMEMPQPASVRELLTDSRFSELRNILYPELQKMLNTKEAPSQTKLEEALDRLLGNVVDIINWPVEVTNKLLQEILQLLFSKKSKQKRKINVAQRDISADIPVPHSQEVAPQVEDMSWIFEVMAQIRDYKPEKQKAEKRSAQRKDHLRETAFDPDFFAQATAGYQRPEIPLTTPTPTMDLFAQPNFPIRPYRPKISVYKPVDNKDWRRELDRAIQPLLAYHPERPAPLKRIATPKPLLLSDEDRNPKTKMTEAQGDLKVDSLPPAKLPNQLSENKTSAPSPATDIIRQPRIRKMKPDDLAGPPAMEIEGTARTLY